MIKKFSRGALRGAKFGALAGAAIALLLSLVGFVVGLIRGDLIDPRAGVVWSILSMIGGTLAVAAMLGAIGAVTAAVMMGMANLFSSSDD